MTEDMKQWLAHCAKRERDKEIEEGHQYQLLLLEGEIDGLIRKINRTEGRIGQLTRQSREHRAEYRKARNALIDERAYHKVTKRKLKAIQKVLKDTDF